MDGIMKFFEALFKMIKGMLIGNGRFEEVGYMEMVKDFLWEGIFGQF